MYLFVYGTLRRGFQNPFRQLLESHATFISDGYVQGKMFDLGDYPGLILSHSAEDIAYGEIYQIHSLQILNQLDLYENYDPRNNDCLFQRTIAKINTPKGKSLRCIIYTYNHEVKDKTQISEGDYLVYLGNDPICTKNNLDG